ncbi:hypothetical protein [Deinococcus sp. 6GRE01]|uniref:hypothetical protein n=1 Tax=Deinococcus sp. 6GRE01 TaxID=2745873 RepID=UPI001E3ADE08|nr:hypothetical protein [Deinococcus sp. 6GRE01]MCD0155668.1 hypothetical protein [Deinococcus sp. 6GRE01]
MQQLMNAPGLCLNFPMLPDAQLDRSEVLSTIEDMVLNGDDIIVISGSSQVGKTFLLAKIVEKHDICSLAIFLNTASRFAYSLDIIRSNLVLQGKVILGDPIDVEAISSEAEYRRVITRLQAWAKTRGKVIYFAVDGLSELFKKDEQAATLLVEAILPLGLGEFKFILTLDSQSQSKLLDHNLRQAHYHLGRVAPLEVKNYFSDICKDERIIDELYKITKGTPGGLSTVRRLITSGVDLADITSGVALESDAGFFRVEWERFSFESESLKEAYAVITFGRRVYSIGEISRIAGVEIGQLTEFFASAPFVETNQSEGAVRFYSDAHKLYAANRLQEAKDQILAKLVDYTFSSGDDSTDIAAEYYIDLGRNKDLLTYMSPAYFETLLHHRSSLGELISRAQLGLQAATSIKSVYDISRLSFQSSMMHSMQNLDVLKAEVEALLSLSSVSEAIEVAQSTLIREHRCLLLSIILKHQKEINLVVQEEILEQVRALVGSLSFRKLEDLAGDIAAELLWVDHELALEVTKKAVRDQDSDIDTDLAYTKLSLTAASRMTNKNDVDKVISDAQKRIKNPGLIKINDSVNLITQDRTAESIIESIRDLSTENKVLFINAWLDSASDSEQISKMIDYAQVTIITDSTYTPKAQDYRSIAKALLKVEDADTLSGTKIWLEEQIKLIEKVVATEESVRLQLALASIEVIKLFDAIKGGARVVDLYLNVAKITDESTKVAALSWMLAELKKIDVSGSIEKKEQLQEIIRENIEITIRSLLNSTADHYHVSKNALIALSDNGFDTAVRIASSLNTEERRDDSFQEIAHSIIASSEPNLENAIQAIDSITSLSMRSDSIVRLLARYNRKRADYESLNLNMKRRLVILARDIIDLPSKCQALALTLSLLSQSNDSDLQILFNDHLKLLDSYWSKLEPTWLKPLWAYKITKTLAPRNPEVAKHYLDLAAEVEILNDISSPELADSNLMVLRLATRIYRGLVNKNLDREDDLERLEKAFSFIPSKTERITLWVNIGVGYVNQKRIDKAERIYTKYIAPLMNLQKEEDGLMFAHAFSYSAPFVFKVSRSVAEDELKSLDKPSREQSAWNIIDYIFKKQLSDEPYSYVPGVSYSVTYNELREICDILEFIDNDSAISSIIESCVNSTLDLKSSNRITAQQIQDVKNRLEAIVNKKLPDQNNIRHEGYLFLCRAYLIRLGQNNRQAWSDLAEQVRGLPNIADRSYVLMILADILPGAMQDLAKQLFEESERETERIPTDVDKIGRFTFLGEVAHRKFPQLSRAYLSKAMTNSISAEEGQASAYMQRRIIDVAHRFDPEYAKHLASLADDDATRIQSRMAVKNELNLQNYRKRIADQRKSDDKIAEDLEHLPSAAWQNLARLNAGRVSALRPDDVIEHFRSSANLAIYEAYPVISWGIQNLVQRSINAKDAFSLFKNIFEAIMSSVELTQRLTVKLGAVSTNSMIGPQSSKNINSDKSIIINDGDREKAIEFISRWLSEAVESEIIIADPYFGKSDLDILKLINELCPDMRVIILTSKKQQAQDGHYGSIEDAFKSSWFEISDQDPPDTEVMIVGLQKSQQLPIHDRWWISKNSGIKLGTSYKSLGMKLTSSISVMDKDDFRQIQKEIYEYLKRNKREVNGERVMYSIFSL